MIEWHPSARLDALRSTAAAHAAARAYFAEQDVLEVITPCLGRRTVTDPHIASLHTEVTGPAGTAPARHFLQTSPEAAMKRLLAAGSGSIYRLGPAFRDGEVGPVHAVEFTLLEWYRCGFDHLMLMDDVERLVRRLHPVDPARRTTYRAAFLTHAAVDPFLDPDERLQRRCVEAGMDRGSAATLDRDECLDLLVARMVAPALGNGLVFVHDFPVSMAALARVRPGEPPVAERFEAFLDGVEIANGYHELTDGEEQARRFEADRARRSHKGLPDVEPDERLLAALDSGLGSCAGVALGLDRLQMVATGARSIRNVQAFAHECA